MMGWRSASAKIANNEPLSPTTRSMIWCLEPPTEHSGRGCRGWPPSPSHNPLSLPPSPLPRYYSRDPVMGKVYVVLLVLLHILTQLVAWWRPAKVCTLLPSCSHYSSSTPDHRLCA